MALLSIAPRLGGLASDALLTGTAGNTGNAFAAGSVILSGTPTSAILTASGMTPGSSTTGSLTVASSGTLLLRYAMQTSATNPDGKGLGGQLQLIVRERGTSCAAFDGLELYNGPLGSAAIGDPATGAQAGDRLLSAATSESLCLRASLPVSTPIGFESATTTATFTFSAEQASNNP